jgi:hypothetical protein
VQEPTKQGELVPAKKSEANLDEVLRAAQPLMDQWTHAQVTSQQEETKRVQLQEEHETKRFAMELDAERQPRLFDFLITTMVILGLLAVIAWAAATAREVIVTHGLALLVGLIGGYGVGQARAAKTKAPGNDGD